MKALSKRVVTLWRNLVGSTQNILYGILAVAGLLRLLSVFVLRTYRHPVTWEFGEQARTLYAGYGYTIRQPSGVYLSSAHMPPLYPLLLDAMWKLFGTSFSTYLVLEVVQAACGVLLVFYVHQLSRIYSSSRVALIAAFIVGVWPSFVYLCNEFHSISIYIVLGVMAVYYVVHFTEVSCSWRDVAGFGFSMGALLLCRAEAIVLLPCYALIMVWHRGSKAFTQVIVGCLLALGCLSPWALRNYHAFGQVVLVSTSGGFNLWVGHNAGATGNADYDVNWLTPDQKALFEVLPFTADREVKMGQLFGHFAREYISTHPKRELSLATRKSTFFLFADLTHKKGRQPAYWLSSIVLTILGGYGMWTQREKLLKSYLSLTITMAFALSLAIIFFSLPRYRITIDPFVAIFAAHALGSIFAIEAYHAKDI